MQYSVVNKINIFSRYDARFDAEFYKQLYITNDEIIKTKSWKFLYEIKTKITDGTHQTPIYKNDGKPFLSAVNVKENYLDLDCGFNYISEDEHRFLFKRCNPQSQDILLRKVGVGPRYATVVPDDIFEFSLFVSVALIKQKFLNPYFLSTYINSKYGQLQLLRFNKGISQPDLHLEDIERLIIPVLNDNFQNNIAKICIKSSDLQKEIKQSQEVSFKLLLDSIMLMDYIPSNKKSYVKNFSDVQTANRLDAEYFQPKYDELIDKIKSYPHGWDTLENLIKLRDKNFSPKDETKYTYIELANINNNGSISDTALEIGKNLPTRARRIVKTGDVIVSSIEGSLNSIALITPQYDNALCSTGFYVMHSDEYNPETLFCLMKSVVGQMQLKKGCSGTILTAINNDELSKIILPRIDNETQNKIKEKISEMYESMQKSKQLLEIAKHGVEKAIEENEDIAMQWIDEQLKLIGVTL